jgi:hypothetical protein
MNYKDCIKKIDGFLSKDNPQPLIVDVQSRNSMSKLLTNFCVGTTKTVPASDFCGSDGFPQLEELFHSLQTRTDDCFVTGLTSFLKLQGERELSSKLREILGMTTSAHVILISFQCRRYLTFHDPRLNRRIVVLDEDMENVPEIYFCSPSLPAPNEVHVINGIEHFGSAVESSSEPAIYIATNKTKALYPYALYNITDLRKAYDVLAIEDPKTKELDEKSGTEKQWQYALTLFGDNPGWDNTIDAEFGDHSRLEIYVPGIAQLKSNRDRLWLYYIGLKLYGVKNNWCLNDAAERSSSIKEMASNIYRGILSKNPEDNDFWDCYKSRKQLLMLIGNPPAELDAFCKLVIGKENNEIYYLTDNSQQEKEEIFAFLDKYGAEFDKTILFKILQKVYPDLYAYLEPYDFKNALLNSYFADYKYQKVINKLLPKFYEVVLDQAKKREYNSVLDPRSSLVEKLPRDKALLYFMDAMGVEYLSYIREECKRLNLKLNIKVCRCELPSITSQNKEFLSGWNEDQIVSVKDIDDIKHHGKYNFDYYKNSKLPIHLIKELEVIHDVLGKIKTKLLNDEIKEAIMISDHGASRLVVLHDTENVWEMTEKGEHSGRCCKKSEVDMQPKYAADAGEYWALANYDRFKGSRKANVEVHGGAALEEICVPIIRITYSNNNVEVFIMPIDSTMDDIDKTPEIVVSYRKKAAIKIFMTEEQSDVSVMINKKKYTATFIGNGYYRADMPDIKKAGSYMVDVYSGDNTIAEQLPLIVKREGQKINDLL